MLIHFLFLFEFTTYAFQLLTNSVVADKSLNVYKND